jgi:hypothetical protein
VPVSARNANPENTALRAEQGTLLQSSGASVKTTQEPLRHISPIMTLGIDAKAVAADKGIAKMSLLRCFS